MVGRTYVSALSLDNFRRGDPLGRPFRARMNYLAYFILGALLLGLALLAVPISLGYDSTQKWFQVTWLGLTLTRRLGREKPEKIRQPATPKPRKNYGRAVRARLWQERDMLVELILQAGRFVLEVIRSLSFRDSEASLSLPDPMWNGVLYGVLANIHLAEMNLSVNFEQRNYAKIRVTLYPHRVARSLAALLIRLPYLNLLRLTWDLKSRAKRS
jgi:hypothetical protein